MLRRLPTRLSFHALRLAASTDGRKRERSRNRRQKTKQGGGTRRDEREETEKKETEKRGRKRERQASKNSFVDEESEGGVARYRSGRGQCARWRGLKYVFNFSNLLERSRTKTKEVHLLKYCTSKNNVYEIKLILNVFAGSRKHWLLIWINVWL